MSEDRTQPASTRRRQLAREQGQVAHSPELTAAAGWLVAVVLLGSWGGELVRSLATLTRRPLHAVPIAADAVQLVADLRAAAAAIAAPLAVLMMGFALGAVAAHQAQVRGLWAPSLLAPDLSRLWSVGRGGGLGAGLERIAWATVKAVVLVAVSAWAIRSEWVELRRLGLLDSATLASASGRVILWPLGVLAAVMVAVGLADLGLKMARFEAMLRTTPDEHREDQKALEGDLSLRARRRRMARAWRGDAPELLAGATLIVTGANGLTIILGGGPPPRRVNVRSAAKGATGFQLRLTNRTARIPEIEAPALSLRLGPFAANAPGAPESLPADLIAALADAWPVAASERRPGGLP
ncbi:EscU/YscU/HrcU family type III secretion system export apparatus switch protein [Aquisphaera insulae]|uniref:EscU/YscU/HrcU family type III secretion system export apparatus switch protein n=1 Tax=Aquisphaera insulae TaxID=2712864 RepID=UPI0013E9E15B|nr:EscU/YscU/HrcU family type III secretion system export apparatus switch protein [Aquisphaera insulae]